MRSATSAARCAGCSITWRRPHERACSAITVLPSSDADGAVIGDERADVSGVIGRHRVAIGVDADERLGVDLDGLDAVGLGQRIGQRQEARALVGEHLADRALRDRRVRAGMRDLVDEPGEVRDCRRRRS